jgi:predicted lipoprotein with Yx(FWY)xxD motif
MSTSSLRFGLRGVAGLTLVALLAAACSSSSAGAIPSSVNVTPAPASLAPAASSDANAGAGKYGYGGGADGVSPATGPVTVGTATTSLGPVLVGPNGRTLYTHAGDTASTSSCTGGCATAWPPLAVAAGAMASGGTGVSGTFATLTRADGTTQVTYNGLPLYGWQGDSKPGDVTGQGVDGFSAAKP